MKTEELALQLDAEPPMPRNVSVFMVSAEAPIVMTKAAELFIREISTRAWKHTYMNRRKTIQRSDIYDAVNESEVYDFLIDLVPRVVTPTTHATEPHHEGTYYPTPVNF
jgi:nuclear transcription factor Y, gamma